jgi:hypothetical protein
VPVHDWVPELKGAKTKDELRDVWERIPDTERPRFMELKDELKLKMAQSATV